MLATEQRAGDSAGPEVDAGAGVLGDLRVDDDVGDLQPAAGTKDAVFAEIDRVLRPGGRLQVADVVIHTEVSEDGRKRIDLWTG